jgi:hypothetical protein
VEKANDALNVRYGSSRSFTGVRYLTHTVDSGACMSGHISIDDILKLDDGISSSLAYCSISK